MFSNYNGIKQERKNKKQLEKSPNVWKLSNIFQYNPWERWPHNGYFKTLTEWKLKYDTSKCVVYS